MMQFPSRISTRVARFVNKLFSTRGTLSALSTSYIIVQKAATNDSICTSMGMAREWQRQKLISRFGSWKPRSNFRIELLV